MAGAWAKLFVLVPAVERNLVLGIVVAVNAVIAAWYYLAVVKRMFLEAPEVEDSVEVPYLLRAAMGVAAVALVAAFVYPPLITDLAEKSLFG